MVNILFIPIRQQLLVTGCWLLVGASRRDDCYPLFFICYLSSVVLCALCALCEIMLLPFGTPAVSPQYYVSIRHA